MQLKGCLEHLERPWVNAYGVRAGLAVEPADVAIRLVKAHQPMHLRNGIECGVDGAVRAGSAGACNLDLHEGAEQRPCATDVTGDDCHRPPIFVSRLR